MLFFLLWISGKWRPLPSLFLNLTPSGLVKCFQSTFSSAWADEPTFAPPQLVYDLLASNFEFLCILVRMGCPFIQQQSHNKSKHFINICWVQWKRTEARQSRTHQNWEDTQWRKLRTSETLMVDILRHLNALYFLDAFVAVWDRWWGLANGTLLTIVSWVSIYVLSTSLDTESVLDVKIFSNGMSLNGRTLADSWIATEGRNESYVVFRH